MKHTLQTGLCLLFLALTLVQCTNKNRLDIDVSHVSVEINIERVDSLWPKMTPISFRSEHPRLLEDYTTVYTHYIEDVLKMGKITDTNLFMSIRSFVTHPDFSEVFAAVNEQYSDVQSIEDELTSAWQHYGYYFPDKTVPKHLSCVGGFNSPFIMTESEIGICFELYLGQDCKFYEYLQWPLYQRKRMSPEHLVPWMMKGWLETEFPAPADQTNLLQDIVHQGKILYALDAMMPSAPDSLKLGYTRSEMSWATDHERMVWAHFVDNELLFNTEPSIKGKFTNDGPFTVDLVKESPSRMGHYIGWQIVRAYMENQKTIDLNNLMRTEAQTILNQSKYKP